MIAVATRTPRITNKAAIEALRANARIRWISDSPFMAEVKSPTSGEVHTIVQASDDTLLCRFCLARYGRETCWVHDKVLAALPGHVERVVAAAPKPEPKPAKEPKKYEARSWAEVYQEKKALTVLHGGAATPEEGR